MLSVTCSNLHVLDSSERRVALQKKRGSRLRIFCSLRSLCSAFEHTQSALCSSAQGKANSAGSWLSGLLCTLLVLLGSFAPAAAHAVTEAEYAAAINVAGRQRMLTQKMAKEALFVHLGVDAEGNASALQATMTLFEDSLNHLLRGDADLSIPKPPSDKVKASLNKVQSKWATYKSALNSGSVSQISKLSTPILKEMNKAVKAYEIASVKAGIRGKGKTINVAGRQRMLSQKMAKELLLIAANEDKTGNTKALESTKTLFQVSLDALKKGSKKMRINATSSSKIQAQLKVVSELWADYKPLLEDAKTTSGPLAPEVLSKLQTSSLSILSEMNKAVGMYETLSES